MDNSPIPLPRLNEIANEACKSTFHSVSEYDHSQTSSWNTTIINSILRSLIAATTTTTTTTTTASSSSSSSSVPPTQPYKFAVNSTIIQHSPPLSRSSLSLPSSATASANEVSNNGNEGHATAGEESSERTGGRNDVGTARRGMHSASGAYWNTEKDGMWSFKYGGGEGRGFDVVISVIWIANA